MKRLTTALAAIGLSASVFAALPAGTNPTEVSIPQFPGGFVFGVSGFYLQPTASNGDLDYASVNTGTAPNFNSSIASVEPGYDWGWGANLGYIFPNTGNDVNLSYFHLDTKDTDSVSVASDKGFLVPLNIPYTHPFLVGLTYTDSAKAEYDIDRADLTAGQFINVGCRLRLRPNVGATYARLDRKLDNAWALQYTPPDPALLQIDLLTSDKSEFSGFGPIAGIDASYYMGMGFGAIAHADTALLVGDIDDTTNLAFMASGSVRGALNKTLKADSERRIVPVTDLKLGGDFTYLFNNTTHSSDLTLEVGYQVSHYYNAVDRIIAQEGSDPFIPTNHITSDVGIQGPYASLILHL